MSIEPVERLSAAFGRVLRRFRERRGLPPESVALAVGLVSGEEVNSMERGQREPALSDFFRIANVLGEPPALFLIDVIDSWRADPAQDALYKSRASDFARLYRLGYYEDPGDFREQQRAFSTLDEAAATAATLNAARHSRRLKVFDTVSIYIRMGHVSFAWEPESALSRPADETSRVLELHDRIAASIEEVRAALAHYRRRPGQQSRAAIDELRTELRRLRRAFGAYEIDIDRVSEQLTQPDLDRLRETIRREYKSIDDMLWNLLDERSEP